MGMFLGYRIKSTNISRVASILQKAKENLYEGAMEEYHRLLSEEIAGVVDDITLNLMQRPPHPILDEAVRRLNAQIERAETLGTGTEYDLRAGVTVIPDKTYTYLMLSVSNPSLVEVFAKTGGIEDYTVDMTAERENSVPSERAAKWESLRKACGNGGVSFTAALTNRMVVEPERLTLIPKEDRAMDRARWNMTARLMNSYAGGQEIHGEQLMPILDKALLRLTDCESEAMAEMSRRLAATLIDISMDLVTKDPRQSTQDEEAIYKE